MQRVAVVVQRPASAFKIELAEMVADSFQQEGTEPSLAFDGDDSFMGAEAAVLFGDCLGFRKSQQLLRGGGFRRPETVLWQLEPFPPRLDSRWRMSGRRAALAGQWSRLQRSSLWEVLRAVAPNAVKTMTRKSVERMLIGEIPDPGDTEQRIRNRNPGVRRFARVNWIERAVREGWLDHVVVSSPERVELLAARNIRSRFFPVGYHPRMGSDEGQKRDLAVVFLGRLKRGRKPVLDRLTQSLLHKGVRLTLNEGPCFGHERSHFLNRAKISVNILNDVWELSRSRLTFSMACGAMVVSEPVGDSSPFVPGKHLVTAAANEMPDAIAHYLAEVDERRAIVEQARDLVLTELSMRNLLQQMTNEWATNPFA